jgi:hypothetical protein
LERERRRLLEEEEKIKKKQEQLTLYESQKVNITKTNIKLILIIFSLSLKI